MMYTREEVAKHSNKHSLWVVKNNKVYDVTEFSSRHPGGLTTLVENAGQDVQQVMRDDQSHQHSKSAYTMLEQYYKGDLRLTDDEATVRRRNNNEKIGKEWGFLDTPVEDEEELQYHGWEEDELIDWSQPLVWQVGRLGNNYMEWVHSPVDKQIRFFGTEFVERLCISPWWLVPIVWMPVLVLFLSMAHNNLLAAPEVWLPWLNGGFAITVGYIPVLFFLGALSWTFLEYCVHRYFFHLRPPPASRILITLHFLIHGQHHKSPMDRNRLVFPPVPASFFAVVFWSMYMSLFPRGMAQAMLAGLCLGYIIYDLMHYYLHHGGSPTTSYLRGLKKYHIKHHFTHQQLGFGISTKFWDYPFGTVIPE